MLLLLVLLLVLVLTAQGRKRIEIVRIKWVEVGLRLEREWGTPSLYVFMEFCSRHKNFFFRHYRHRTTTFLSIFVVCALFASAHDASHHTWCKRWFGRHTFSLFWKKACTIKKATEWSKISSTAAVLRRATKKIVIIVIATICALCLNKGCCDI